MRNIIPKLFYLILIVPLFALNIIGKTFEIPFLILQGLGHALIDEDNKIKRQKEDK